MWWPNFNGNFFGGVSREHGLRALLGKPGSGSRQLPFFG